MAVVSIAELKEELAFTADIGAVDDALLIRKINAAQDHVERLLGYQITQKFPELTPPALSQAICQLAAHWYENRELTGDGRASPFGLNEIIAEYRDYTF